MEGRLTFPDLQIGTQYQLKDDVYPENARGRIVVIVGLNPPDQVVFRFDNGVPPAGLKGILFSDGRFTCDSGNLAFCVQSQVISI